MGIRDDELARLAELARLELEPADAERFREDLNRVLAYFDTLSELDTTGVEPLIRPLPVEHALRDDVIVPPLERGAALALGSSDGEGRFVVPRTVDEGN